MITQLKRLLPTPGVTGRGCLAWSRTRFSWQRLALKSAVSAEVCRSCRHFWINSFTTRCWKWVLQTVRYQHSAGWSCRACVCVTLSLSLNSPPRSSRANIQVNQGTVTNPFTVIREEVSRPLFAGIFEPQFLAWMVARIALLARLAVLQSAVK